LTSEASIGQEKEEKSVVVESNTIIDPRTMMIKINDTSIAKRAMMGISRFWEFTFTAVVCVISILDVMQKMLIVPSSSRRSESC